MAKIVEPKPLTSYQTNSGLDSGGANLVSCHNARAQRRLALQLQGREYPVVGFGTEKSCLLLQKSRYGTVTRVTENAARRGKAISSTSEN